MFYGGGAGILRSSIKNNQAKLRVKAQAENHTRTIKQEPWCSLGTKVRACSASRDDYVTELPSKGVTPGVPKKGSARALDTTTLVFGLFKGVGLGEGTGLI